MSSSHDRVMSTSLDRNDEYDDKEAKDGDDDDKDVDYGKKPRKKKPRRLTAHADQSLINEMAQASTMLNAIMIRLNKNHESINRPILWAAIGVPLPPTPSYTKFLIGEFQPNVQDFYNANKEKIQKFIESKRSLVNEEDINEANMKARRESKDSQPKSLSTSKFKPDHDNSPAAVNRQLHQNEYEADHQHQEDQDHDVQPERDAEDKLYRGYEPKQQHVAQVDVQTKRQPGLDQLSQYSQHQPCNCNSR